MLRTPARHQICEELAKTRPPEPFGAATPILRRLSHKAMVAVGSADRREAARFRALSRVAEVLAPEYVMTAPEKAWFSDEQFFREFYAFEDHDQTDRKYMLRQLLHLVNLVAGDTAECGVYLGASSWFICDHVRSSDRTHHGFDSFEGLSEPRRARRLVLARRRSEHA